MNRHYVLIVAGGKGLRMGHDLPKQFIPLQGKPVLMHTLDNFRRFDPGARLILVLPESHQSYWQMLCKEIGCKTEHVIVHGGETRFHSVLNGLQWIKANDPVADETAFVAVHDGVRPFASAQVVTRCFKEVQTCDAVIPVIPMIDSLRQKDHQGTHPVDRSHYFAVQTPQVFNFELLWEAYQQPFNEAFTDDASVVEAFGHTVHVTEGNRENLKITTPFDLLIANALCADASFDSGLI